MVTDPPGRKISMRRTEYAGSYHSGKTGPLKCNKGFTARARLKTPARGKSLWLHEWVYLIDAKVPVWKCWNKIQMIKKRKRF